MSFVILFVVFAVCLYVVVTENSVRAENAEVPSIHEILVVSR